MNKRCPVCAQVKVIEDFHNNKRRPDGKEWCCKICHNQKRHEAYVKHKQGEIANVREWQGINKSKVVDIKTKWNNANKDKRLAHSRLNHALQRGKKNKPSFCSICGVETILHGHHSDYNSPLDVIWLCPQCHKEIHHERIRA